MTPAADVLKWVEAQLDSLEEYPEMWGTLLCVELQYLLLLEMKLAFTVEPPGLDQAIQQQRHRWCRTIGACGFAPNLPMAEQLGDYAQGADFEALIGALSALRKES